MRAHLLVLTVLLALAAPAAAGTYSSLAADDGHVIGPASGAYDTLDTQNFVALILDGTWTVRREALFEYDLSSIPSGAQITAATWRIQTSSENGVFQVHAYAGDGVLELADGTTPDNPVGSLVGGTFGFRDVVLDLPVVQALVDQGTGFLGLICRGVPGEQSSLQISTKEISSAEARAARLILEWAEPTPAPKAGRFALRGASPNPFNPATEIRFELERAGDVSLDIYDVKGRTVRSLLHGHRSAGVQRVRWNGADNRGRELPSGVYFAVLRDPGSGHSEVSKLTLVR